MREGNTASVFENENQNILDSERRDALASYIQSLIEHSDYVGEGNNGVVLKVSLDELDEQGIAALQEFGLQVDAIKGEAAVKIIKVYESGAADNECDMQAYAAEILEKATIDGKKDLAKVPRVLLSADLSIDPHSLDHVLHQTHNFMPQEKMGIVMMDYVEADDLATILYREALRLHDGYRDEGGQLDEMSYDELQEAVWRVFGFARPGGKSGNEGERVFEKEKVFADNQLKLMTFLRKRGFRLHPSIYKQIKNTLDLFHKSGLVHRDCHARNFLISGDYIASDAVSETAPQVWSIDFGSARKFDGPYTESNDAGLFNDEVAANTVRRYPPDGSILRQIEPLSKTQEEEKALRIEKLKEEIAENLNIAMRNNWYETHMQLIEQEGEDALEKLVPFFRISQDNARYMGALLYAAFDHGYLYSGDIGAFITKNSKKFDPYAKGILSKLHEVLQ